MAGYLLITNTCFNIDTVLSGFRAGRQLFWLRQQQAVAFLGIARRSRDHKRDRVGAGLGDDRRLGHLFCYRLVVAVTISLHESLATELRAGFRTLPDILRFGIARRARRVRRRCFDRSGNLDLGMISTVSVVGAFNRAYTLGLRFMELNNRIAGDAVSYPCRAPRS